MATPNLTSITSVIPGLLVQQQLSSTSYTNVYTVPTGKAVKLSKLLLTNAGSTSVNILLSLTKSGGSLDGSGRILSNYPLGAGDCMAIPELEGMMLGEGDFISVAPDVTGAINVHISGLVMS